jgi:two-component system chemotaxis response regulator CheB
VTGEAEPGSTLRARLPIGLAFGASTGGPKALLTLLPDLVLPQMAYAFLVQHIHPTFVAILRRRLREVTPVPVEEAGHDQPAQPGTLYLAPGGRHLRVRRVHRSGFRTYLTEEPPLHGVRPSLDVLFASVAEAFGDRAIGVVLTGMGRDGLEGARAIKARGGRILAEAESSCVVYGMPRAMVEAGLADRQVPIQAMAGAVHDAVRDARLAPARCQS